MKLEFEPNITAVEYAESVSAGKEAFAGAGNEAAKMFEAGVKMAQEGRSAEARNLLLQATEADPSNESAWLWLASISEYPEELLVFLNSALKINPDNERALEWAKATKSLLSKTFVERGIDASKNLSKDFAKQCFLQAVVHDNQNETAWLWLASVSDAEEEKTVYLQKVLEVNPANKTALFSLNALKNQQAESVLQNAVKSAVGGDYESALAALEELSEIEDAWVLKAYLVRSFDEKMKCFERILELNPDNDTAQANLLTLLSLTEKIEPAQNFEAHAFSTEEPEEVCESNVAEEGAELLFRAGNRGETEAASPESAAQKSKSSQNFSLPEKETINDTPQAFDDFETAFDAPESVEEQVASPEAEEVPADVERPIDEAAGFGYDGDVNFSQNYSHAKPENHARPAEAENASNASESIEETQIKDGESRVEESCLQNTKNDDEDASDVYEIETDDLTLPEAAEFEENEQNSSMDNGAPFDEGDSQTAKETAARAQNTNFGDNNVSRNEPHESPIEAKCPFCSAENEAQAFVCRSCRAALSFSDLEMILADREVDLELVGNAVRNMENERSGRELSANELKSLGIGYLSLKNSREALSCLKKVVQINPDDVVFSSQVNALALRLADIERQESIHSSIPKNRTILVVDDSATVRKLISGKLEKSGHEVVCAVDGIDALDKLQTTVPDLILLDINMPRMDGYQVCKLIRANEAMKDVPVVMISGKDGFFDKVRGRMAGTTGYITKPFGPETLMKTIEAYVTQPVE